MIFCFFLGLNIIVEMFLHYDFERIVIKRVDKKRLSFNSNIQRLSKKYHSRNSLVSVSFVIKPCLSFVSLLAVDKEPWISKTLSSETTNFRVKNKWPLHTCTHYTWIKSNTQERENIKITTVRFHFVISTFTLAKTIYFMLQITEYSFLLANLEFQIWRTKKLRWCCIFLFIKRFNLKSEISLRQPF